MIPDAQAGPSQGEGRKKGRVTFSPLARRTSTMWDRRTARPRAGGQQKGRMGVGGHHFDDQIASLGGNRGYSYSIQGGPAPKRPPREYSDGHL